MPRFPKAKKSNFHAKRKVKRPQERPYDKRQWRRLRDIVEARDLGLCQICLEKGKITEAIGRKGSVDHKVAIRDGGALYDPNNLQLLCLKCHAVKSAREGIQRLKD
jgi:5-methylcytosine-specific restriction endonuclease McrA